MTFKIELFYIANKKNCDNNINKLRDLYLGNYSELDTYLYELFSSSQLKLLSLVLLIFSAELLCIIICNYIYDKNYKIYNYYVFIILIYNYKYH